MNALIDPALVPTLDLPTADGAPLAMPVLGFGTFELEGDACREGVREALELGYRHIDTAQIYDNERQVGAGLAEAMDALSLSRDQVFVTTKVWFENLAPEDVRRTTDESLQRLGLDHVDLLLIHWPHRDIPLADTLGAFQEVQRAGKTRAIGVSNFTPPLLRQALELAPVACNQVEYHPYLGQEDLLEIVRSNDLVLTAYSPIARGEVTEDETLREIGEGHGDSGKSAPQVALRWLVQQDRVAAIPKASSSDHRRSNLDLFDFALSPEEMEQIHGLERGRRLIDPDFAPDW